VAGDKLEVPNPDPTTATTTQLLREITGSRELAQILVNFTREIVEHEITGNREIAAVRLDHLERIVNSQPTLIEKATEFLRLNVDEKLKVFEGQFANVQTQFEERDTRQETGRSDATKAIDAAFASADKAINKTESGFKDQIAEQGKRIDTVSKGADEKIDALKELINDQKDRITIIESRTIGITSHKTEANQGTTIVVSIVGVLVSIAALMAVVIIELVKH